MASSTTSAVQHELAPGVDVRIDAPSARAGRRIDALLDAAATEVAERGREALTTAEVAARAEVSIGTVYRYFPDRTALLEGLGARARNRVQRHLVEVLAIAPPGEETVARALVWAIRASRDAEPSYLALGIGERVDPLGADGVDAAWIEATAPAATALGALGVSESRARRSCVRAAMVADAMLRSPDDVDQRTLDALVAETMRRSLASVAAADAA
ncbi:TetR/AcrR family transcriptional regulator [Agrococcus jejuensis]|uniref:DNA-binding transcriptional regulator, AcrR family n=1 Tax=Agrococcus jejuensis TaxID=399736 RepID=A0A1G8D8N0_9MICO|nr:TetR/AcrR family transcriptional regulator [Agrococcus jejuensis]SDH53923.1 DNA-binding transcriptional regulator, AcrR family [Agrococcus jejuensis]